MMSIIIVRKKRKHSCSSLSGDPKIIISFPLPKANDVFSLGKNKFPRKCLVQKTYASMCALVITSKTALSSPLSKFQKNCVGA